MSFLVERKVNLDFLGAQWGGAELVFNALSFRETKEFASISVDKDKTTAQENEKNFEVVANILEKKFVRGKAWNGTALVDLKAEDLLDLPIEAINKSVELLVGGISPN